MHIEIRDRGRERQIFLNRAIIALVGAVLLFAVLVGRLVYLQVLEHEHFTTLSQGNRVQIQPVPPTRGLIYDRDGRILAENLPSFRLDIIPEEVDDLESTLADLSELVEIRPRDVERFRRQLSQERMFESVPLRYRLTEEELAQFAVNRSRFPGVEVRANLSRQYPQGGISAHVVGYVAGIDEQDMQRLERSEYAGTTHIGQTGIEQSYEKVLHGDPGYRKVEVTAQGRNMRVLESQAPVPGRNLYLTIDAELQRVAAEALGEENGAVVAIEPDTGEVLAMVSRPGFDPNAFVTGIDPVAYAELTTSREKPMFNRAIRGRYPPGSTIKPFLGFAAMEADRPFGPDGVSCPGFYRLPGTTRRYRDWKRGGHGRTPLKKAIEESCDVYFYKLAVELGIERLHDAMTRFGFGSRTGIDIAGERSGLVPSRAWKRKVYGKSWYRGETVITGIGQGFTLVTPIQLAQGVATIARRGRRIEPRLVRATENPLTHERRKLQPAEGEPVELGPRADWQTIIDAMEDVVHGDHGTARGIGWDAPYRIAGKTGTAQVFGLAEGEEYNEEEIAKRLRDHALFIAFAPVENPRIAVAVVVEHGGHGSSAAAPVARKVMDAYLLPGDSDDA